MTLTVESNTGFPFHSRFCLTVVDPERKAWVRGYFHCAQLQLREEKQSEGIQLDIRFIFVVKIFSYTENV